MLELLNNPEVLAVGGGVVATLLTLLFVFLRKKAKESETKLDDTLVDAIDKAVEDSKKEKPKE